METKICSKCKIEKEFIEFSKRKIEKDGLNRQCKECIKIYSRKYDKQYRMDKADKIKEHSEKYRKKNRLKMFEYRKQYRKINADKIKAYNIKNADKIKEYQKRYRMMN